MLNVLFSAPEKDWPRYRAPLRAAFAARGLDVRLTVSAPPEQVDYIVYAPSGGLQDFRPFTRARAVMGLWAGVDQIVANPTLTQPLTRMVDQGLREGMVEWVCGHVLRHHLDLDRHILDQGGVWHHHAPPLARQRRVGILGLGALGQAVAQALAGLNFDVAGWARRPKTLTGIRCFSGAAGLDDILAQSQILVLLLPLTADTENLMNADRLAALPRGAVLLNPGRGGLIDDAALLDALDRGGLAHATLDAFRVEPLPVDHPFWAHPKVTVTPHIASETRPETAAEVIAENIARDQSGRGLLHLVDRHAGY